MNAQEHPQQRTQSHLFTVRLWREELGGDASEVRMQVKHVLSGETRYFRSWSELVEYLQRVLHEFNNAGQSQDGDPP